MPPERARWTAQSSAKLVVIAGGLAALAAVAVARFAAPASPLFGWSYSTAMARVAVQVTGQAPPARVQSLVAEALSAQPIAAEPLVVAALAEAAGSPEALALMVEAKRRQPRAALVRAWLADHYMRAGDYRRALVEIDRLVVLRPDLARAMDPVLLSAARTPAGWREVNRAVGANPAWKPSFVTNLLKRPGAETEAENAAFALIANGTGGNEAQNGLRRSLLSRLIRRGEYDRAYLAWVNFLPANAMTSTGPVYDPQFRKLPGLAPFNWTMTTTDEGLAEYAPGGGMDLRFYGRADSVLASQMVMLPSARYTLAITARSPMADIEEAAVIAYRVQCAGSRAVLAQGSLEALGSAAKNYGGTFEVPGSNCPAQTLTISGVAGDATRETSAYVESINITGAAS